MPRLCASPPASAATCSFAARLPAAAVREVRRDVLQEIQRQGYLAPNTPWEDGVARRGTRSLRSMSIRVPLPGARCGRG